jgi:nucleoside-diphosphate-sugar epimerase
MKIFLAGATGVIGRRALVRLVAAGHEVTAIARSEDKAAWVREQGATPARVSLFEPDALGAAVAGHDAVVNLATHIPTGSSAVRPEAWQENARIRTEGARNLADVVLSGGVGRFVQESIAFLYQAGGDRWLDEDAPRLDPDADVVSSMVAAESQAERVTQAGGIGIVLRFGFFHSADSAHTVNTLQAARVGRVGAFGEGDAYYPIVHADDAAAAVVAALDAPAGTYNVVDDEPMTRDAYAAAMASALGDTPRLRPLPAAAQRMAARQGDYMLSSQRASNRRLRDATGWRPMYPSARETWAQIVGERHEPFRVRRLSAAVLLAVLSISTLFVGLWAQLAPESFYDSFPGFGRTWIATEGPYNEHLIRDVGGLNLALAVVTAVAAFTLVRLLVRTAAVAVLVYGVPHFLFHLDHAGDMATVDAVTSLVTLAGMVVAAALVLWLARRPSLPAPRPSTVALVAATPSG